MIVRIRAGSLTTDSLSATGLCWPTSASVLASVTVQPWAEAIGLPTHSPYDSTSSANSLGS